MPACRNFPLRFCSMFSWPLRESLCPTAVSAWSVPVLAVPPLCTRSTYQILYWPTVSSWGPGLRGQTAFTSASGPCAAWPPSCLSADWDHLPAGPSSPGGLAAQTHQASISHQGSALSCSSPMSSTLLIPLSPPTTSRQRSHTSQPHPPEEDLLASAVWTKQGRRSCPPCSGPQPQDPAAARGVERPQSSGDAAADLHNCRHAAAAEMEGMPRLQLEHVAAAGQGAASSSWDSSAARSSGSSDCQGSSGDTGSDSGSSSCYDSADSQSMQSHLSPQPAQHKPRAAGSAVSSRDEEATSDEASSLQQTVAEPQLVSPRPAQAAQGSMEGRSEGSSGLQELGLQSAGPELAAGPEVEGAAAVLEGAAAVASQLVAAAAAAAASSRRQGTVAAPTQQPVVHLLDAPAAGADTEGGCTAVTGSTARLQLDDAGSGFSGVDGEAAQPASPRQISALSGSPSLLPPASHKVNQLRVLWVPVAC